MLSDFDEIWLRVQVWGADLESLIIFYRFYRFVGQVGLKRELNWPKKPTYESCLILMKFDTTYTLGVLISNL